MTQVASCAKKRANGMQCQDSTNTTIIIEKEKSPTPSKEIKEGMQNQDSTNITIEEESPSAAKKLKQARLPFKPLGLKSQLPVNTSPHGVPKKRKLSDQDTPSAKAQKVIINKHQLDRLKHDVSEKREPTDHENEVSSSSEAENVPLSAMHKRKACETNILERFVKKSSQEEISSTNEVVDLTEIENEEPVTSLEITSSKEAKVEHSEVPSNKETKSEKCHDNDIEKTLPKNKDVGYVGEHKIVVVIDDDSDNATIPDKTTANREPKVTAEVTTDLDSKMKKPLPVEISDDEVKVTQNQETKEISTESNSSSSPDVLPTVTEGTREDNSDEKSEESTDKKETVEELENSGNISKTSCLNLSSSTDKSESEAESSSSSDENSDNENDESIADVSGGGNNSVADLSTESHSPKDAVSETKPEKDGISKTSTPNSKLRNRPKSLKMTEVKSQEKKQERDAMKQRIREQKEAARQKRKDEKEQQRLEAKKKKDQERMDKEQKKKEEKEKKEKDRLEKKKMLESEKNEKTQQKEEERKKKQELIDAKLEEKRKKDEEKRLREEEKLREEEEKNKKNMKLKQNFTSFFIKKAQQQAAKPKEESSFFMPFQLKKDMTLAPVYRQQLSADSRSLLDEHILKQECQCLYVDEVVKESYQKGKSLRTIVERPPPEEKDDAIDVDEDNDVMCVEEDEDDKSRQTLERHHCKLIQFHTNYRPPYYGTWRKHSKKITPKNPFLQDTELFDYEVDSDDEWEEEEPGESVSSSEEEGEGEEKEEEPEEEEEDGWMVPHGYLSEDEGCDQDEEITPDLLKARQQAKLDAWEADQKKQTHHVRATVLGCVWDGDDVMDNIAAKLAVFQAVCLSAVPIDLKTPASETLHSHGKDGDKSTINGNRKPVPEEALPDLIRLLHGNVIGMKKLIKEFRLYWKKKTLGTLDTADTSMAVDENIQDKSTSVLEESCTEDKNQTEADGVLESPDDGKCKDSADDCGISKRQLEMKINAIAVRSKRANTKKICWYVHDKVLKQYELEDLALPNTWQYVSKGLIKVKSEERSGRKTPNTLSESFTEAVPLIMKEDQASEDTDKSLRKDQPSIMQFAKKMLPSELPKPKIRRIELKPVNPLPLSTSETKPEPVIDLDSSAPEEMLCVYKVLPRDQRSIMDFAQKSANHSQNGSSILNHGIPKCPQPQSDSKSVIPSAGTLGSCVKRPAVCAKPVVCGKPAVRAKPPVCAKPVVCAEPVVCAKPVICAKPAVVAEHTVQQIACPPTKPGSSLAAASHVKSAISSTRHEEAMDVDDESSDCIILD